MWTTDIDYFFIIFSYLVAYVYSRFKTTGSPSPIRDLSRSSYCIINGNEILALNLTHEKKFLFLNPQSDLAQKTPKNLFSVVNFEIQVGLVICGRFVQLFWTANTEFADKKAQFDKKFGLLDQCFSTFGTHPGTATCRPSYLDWNDEIYLK